MSALIAPSLRSQRRFVGRIDATRDNPRPAPRTLEQCAGMQRSSQARIQPMAEPARMDLADRIVVRGGAVALVALVAMHVAGWLR